jgi:hypothetical protein
VQSSWNDLIGPDGEKTNVIQGKGIVSMPSLDFTAVADKALIQMGRNPCKLPTDTRIV